MIDWRSGKRYELDGSHSSMHIRFGFRFDAAVRSPCGRYVVLYERAGTKGVVLHDGELLREIDRSFYCAESYDFPIALFDLPNGAPAIAHCPTAYNRLEIDRLDTGERLTPRSDESPASDFFHSGLSVDRSGQWLMSAGWVWHPYHQVRFYSLAQALEDPSILDRGDSWVEHNAELPSAAFLGPDLAVLASDPRSETFDEDERAPAAERLGMLGLYRPSSRSWLSRTDIAEPVGEIFVVDENHVLSLYEHPKLVDIRTGRTIARWPEIDSGKRVGCIGIKGERTPLATWDPIGRRLAITASDRIHVLLLTQPS